MSTQREQSKSKDGELDDNPSQAGQKQSLNTNPDVDNRDKLFLSASAIEIFLGLVLVYLPVIPLLLIIPSILIGSGIATFVYRFMGGFKEDDSLAMGGIKIGGALGSLLISAIVVNTFLEKQAKDSQITAEPPQNDVVVVKKNGELVPVMTIKNNLRTLIDFNSQIEDRDFGKIAQIKANCFDGRGICRDGPKTVMFSVDSSLKTYQAKVCQQYFSNLAQLPLFITPPQVASKNNQFGQFALVSVDSPAECRPDESQSDQRMLIYISRGAAKKLGMEDKLQKPGQMEAGEARIASLRGILNSIAQK
jgi:hypothetical protein